MLSVVSYIHTIADDFEVYSIFVWKHLEAQQKHVTKNESAPQKESSLRRI